MGHLRNAEIEDLHRLGLARIGIPHQHDVGGFEVAVNDPFRVRVLEGEQDLASDVACASWLQRPLAGQHLCQRLARHELHDQEELAVRAMAEIGHRDDVGVGKPARRLRLAFESPRSVLNIAELGAQELERQHLLHQGVLDAEDRPHPAFADAAKDAIALADDGIDERIPRDIQHLGGGDF